jgi:predicted nucleic acid-binding protein
MNDRVFIDTNMLIYYISEDKVKANKVQKLLTLPFDFVISTQVVSEFIHTCHRKKLLPADDIRKVVEEFLRFVELSQISESTIFTAFDLKERYGFSWYDSLIIAAAFENNCSILFSEDMHNGLEINGKMAIRNPFLT